MILTFRLKSGTHPYCADEIRQGKVLVTEDCPTVPDGKGDIISGENKKIKLYEDKKHITYPLIFTSANLCMSVAAT